MGAAFQWLIYTPDGEFRLVRRMFDTPVPPKLGPIERMVIFVAGNAVKRCEYIALAGAVELCGEGRVHGLYSSSLSPFEATVSHDVAEELADELEYAIRSGKVLIEEIKWRKIRPAVIPAPTTGGPQPSGSPGEALGWFEVKVVDEVGDAVVGVELEFSLSGSAEKRTTDGSGTARVEQRTESVTNVRFSDEVALRTLLYKRWSVARGRKWVEPLDEQWLLLQVLRRRELQSVSAYSELPRTIVLQPRVVQARLWGLWFDTSKSFLLPTGIDGMRFVAGLYRSNPDTDLLVVGHADESGATGYNDLLSLERARAICAYLTDDVEHWLTWYDWNRPDAKRWGQREDMMMIEEIARQRGMAVPMGQSPVEWYQEQAGNLVLDGLLGPDTRRCIIKDYMDLDGTTLPSDVRLSSHGCGASFPAVAEQVENVQGNRRVELFFFENPMRPPDRPAGVLPPPSPDGISGPASRDYPEWVLRSRETQDFRRYYALMVAWGRDVVDLTPDDLRLRMTSDGLDPVERTKSDIELQGDLYWFEFPQEFFDRELTLRATARGRSIVLLNKRVIGATGADLEWDGSLTELLSDEKGIPT